MCESMLEVDGMDVWDELHRPRCCDEVNPAAIPGLGTADNAFITVQCTSCDTDLVTLDPPSGGDRGVYVGPWDPDRDIDGPNKDEGSTWS